MRQVTNAQIKESPTAATERLSEDYLYQITPKIMINHTPKQYRKQKAASEMFVLGSFAGFIGTEIHLAYAVIGLLAYVVMWIITAEIISER